VSPVLDPTLFEKRLDLVIVVERRTTEDAEHTDVKRSSNTNMGFAQTETEVGVRVYWALQIGFEALL
jgi:hypothetical protein